MEAKMNEHDVSSSRQTSITWLKDTIIILVLIGLVCILLSFFTKHCGIKGGVVAVCCLMLVVLAFLLLSHICYPGSFRRVLAMIVTAIVNRNREAIPPKEITNQLGIGGDAIDKKLVKVANSEMTTSACSERQVRKSDLSLKVLQKVDPQISSVEELFRKVSQTGGKQYFPILRRLHKTENEKFSAVYHLVYEWISDMDEASLDANETAYRKENLKWLINDKNIQDKWLYYRNYIDLCYKDEEYDSIIRCAHEAIICIDDTNSMCSIMRAHVYYLLGSIYLEREQYCYAIPYLEEVVRISKIRVPALFRLAYVYCNVMQDYLKGLRYAQRCFAELPDYDNHEVGAKIERRLIGLIAYCSASCEEYAEGCTTLENYLASTSAKDSKDGLTSIKSNLAYLLIKVGRWENADSLSKEVLSFDPIDYTAINVKGMCAMRHNHYEIAVNCFSKIAPEFEKETSRQSKYFLGEIYNNLAICETKLGRKTEADKHFREAFACGYPAIDVSQFSMIAVGPLGIQNPETKSEAASASGEH